ncbi:TonB-dependent receptor [Chitinophaga lutea]
MKLSALIILSACLQLSAKGYAQQVTLSEKNATLQQLFRTIERQTGYVFFFDHLLLDKASRVTVDIKKQPLEKALNVCLEGQPLSYSIVGKNIVIKSRDAYSPLEPVQFFPQDTTVKATGRVTDKAGMALPGASVVIKNTSTGVVTDAKGFFELKAPKSAILVISFIGYKSQEVAAASEGPINVTLQEQAALTDEVVVIGYGTVKKSDLTGSLSQVRSKDITSYPSTNIMQALNGRAPGVRVMQNNGSPGGGISIRIRGANSILGGNEPLYVVDGFPYPGNPTFLQNSDIASIEVLKDASSTAIYGSRGANGVVMITTKSGKKKEQTSVEFEAGYTNQMVTKKMPLMNAQQYALLYNEQAKNDGLAPYFTQQVIDSLGQNPGTDWQDLVLRNAPIYNASVSVSGGSEKTRFSLGGAAFMQEGIVKASDYNRYNVRGNIEHDISKVFNISYSAILTRLNSARHNASPGNRGNDLISGMLMAPPSLSPYLPNGGYRRLNTAYPFISNVIINPLVFIDKVSDKIQGDRVFTNAALTIKPFDGFSLKITGGIDNLNDRVDKYNMIEPTTNSVGLATVQTTQQTSYLNEDIATYTKEIGKGTLTAMGAFSYQDTRNTKMDGSGNGFLSDVTYTGSLNAAATPGTPSSSYARTTIISYLARVNYSYNDKYLLTASIRRDGYSAYSVDEQWENFPSGAVAWKAINEPFLKNSRFLSDLKVRASYGKSGSNAINAYATLNQLSPSTTIFGDAQAIAYAPGTTLPGNLKWETTYMHDFGLDVGFLQNRLRLTVDYYDKTTRNLLNRVRLPASMGYTTTLQNVGEITNKGLEVAVDADVLRDRAVTWNLNANISFNRNKVVKLYNQQDINGDAFYTGSINDFVNLLRPGLPMGVFYGYKEIGYTDKGLLLYEDVNKDNVISAADKTVIGDPNPNFIYGLNSVTSWKGFELTVFIQGSQGNDIFNLNQAPSLDLGMGLNLPREVYENHWTPENTNAKYPKITRALNGNMSSRFVEDGSYLRFKNIQLAYNLPVQGWGWKWFRSAQVYASAQNMITFTKYSWYDPEVNAYGGSSSINQGIDYSVYPISKSVTFGIRCGF